MIKIKVQYVALYLVGILLFIFGNRQFLEKIEAENKKKELDKEKNKIAIYESNKSFETQKLVYDSINKVWKNNNISFQTVHLGTPKFEPGKNGSLQVESNDIENASESL